MVKSILEGGDLWEGSFPDVHPAVDMAGVLALLHRQHPHGERLEAGEGPVAQSNTSIQSRGEILGITTGNLFIRTDYQPSATGFLFKQQYCSTSSGQRAIPYSSR